MTTSTCLRVESGMPPNTAAIRLRHCPARAGAVPGRPAAHAGKKRSAGS